MSLFFMALAGFVAIGFVGDRVVLRNVLVGIVVLIMTVALWQTN